MSLIEIPREHRIHVNEAVFEGSNPRGRFFAMTALSGIIATFGLLMNSTAVVIGAMLVAPMMTPIMGMALALVQGNSKLFGLAMRSEVIGMLVVIGVGSLLGTAVPFFDATPEMLSRTEPNLLDLMVALFAGCSGAYALVDEKISPAMPGVAMATALVPPLANVGLCLAMGAYTGAYGSLLLFFANFLCILLISAIVFGISGMTRLEKLGGSRTVVRRFGLAVIGLVVVGVLLGRSFSQLIKDRRLQHEVRVLLREELARYRVSELESLSHKQRGEEVAILAHVHAPRVLTPSQVKDIESRLEQELDLNIELYLRMSLTRSVSASGAIGQGFAATLDGFSFADENSSQKEVLLVAEQVVREYLGGRFGQKLVELVSFPWSGGTAILAEVTGVRKLRQNEVKEMADLIQSEVGNEPIRLAVRQSEIEIMTVEGPMRFEFQMRRPPTEEESRDMETLEKEIDGWMARADCIATNTAVTVLGGRYQALVEASGRAEFTAEDIRALNLELGRSVGYPVEVFARVIPDSVISEQGTEAWSGLMTKFSGEVREEYEDATLELIKAWR